MKFRILVHLYLVSLRIDIIKVHGSHYIPISFIRFPLLLPFFLWIIHNLSFSLLNNNFICNHSKCFPTRQSQFFCILRPLTQKLDSLSEYKFNHKFTVTVILPYHLHWFCTFIILRLNTGIIIRKLLFGTPSWNRRSHIKRIFFNGLLVRLDH